MFQLGDRIKYLREKKGKTQKDLSSQIGLTIVQLSRYETNDRKPDPDALKKIADSLETTTDYLVGRTDNPNSDIAQSVKLEETLSDRDVYIAYLGGPPEEIDEEEAEHLKRELEMFRAFKEKRKKDRDGNK